MEKRFTHYLLLLLFICLCVIAMIFWIGFEAKGDPIQDRPGHYVVTREWVNSLRRWERAALKAYIKKHKITYTIMEK